MATWKKVLIGILIVVVLAAIGVGTFFIVKSVKDKKTPDGVVYSHNYLEDTYFVGEKMPVEIVAQDKTAFTAMSYTIDSGEQTTFETTKGESENNPQLDKKNGEFYIDTGVQVIDISELNIGTHVFKVYITHDATQSFLFEHVFKVIAP